MLYFVFIPTLSYFIPTPITLITFPCLLVLILIMVPESFIRSIYVSLSLELIIRAQWKHKEVYRWIISTSLESFGCQYVSSTWKGPMSLFTLLSCMLVRPRFLGHNFHIHNYHDCCVHAMLIKWKFVVILHTIIKSYIGLTNKYYSKLQYFNNECPIYLEIKLKHHFDIFVLFLRL